MLLRLLPTPTPSQPSPPTILFTLPLPANPYTARALPLPANLLAHRSLCIQEDIDCANVLLGDKAVWVSGIIDNVTFSLPHHTILVHFVDGSSANVELSPECVDVLHSVINEVQLSFAAANAPPAPAPQTASPAESPRSSMSSDRSDVSSSSTVAPPASAGRRSPSSLLFSLLSPLLPVAPPKPSHVQAAQQPARAHRRQARSLLVDAYRRYVLPELKERLPPAYLVWAIQSETETKLDEFTAIKDDIAHCLRMSNVSLDPSPAASLHSSVSSSSSASDADASDCDSEFASDLPAPTAAQAFLLSLPSPEAIPATSRSGYASHVSRAAELSARVGEIQRLATRYEREEGKRRWVDELDLQRDADKAVRRAFSNGLLPSRGYATPLRRSPLRACVSAVDIAQPARPHLDLDSISEVSMSDDCLTPDLSDDGSDGRSLSESEPSTPSPRRNSLDEGYVADSSWEREDAPSPEPEYFPKQAVAVSAVAVPWPVQAV